MVDAEKPGAVGALSRRLQAISGGGWTNVQTPVRQGFEAVEATTQGLAEQLAASREDVRRLEARLVGMEEMVRTERVIIAEPNIWSYEVENDECARYTLTLRTAPAPPHAPAMLGSVKQPTNIVLVRDPHFRSSLHRFAVR